MQEDRDADMELSDAWLELLGKQTETSMASNNAIPALESDPWSSLLHSYGVKAVDLQKVHLPISDSDVEQLLHCMQDQSPQHPEL